MRRHFAGMAPWPGFNKSRRHCYPTHGWPGLTPTLALGTEQTNKAFFTLWCSCFVTTAFLQAFFLFSPSAPSRQHFIPRTSNPPDHARCHVPWVKECSAVRVLSFLPYEAGLCVCLSRDLRGRARERFRPTCPVPTMRHLLYMRSIPHVADRERERLWEVVRNSGLPLHG